MKTSKATLLLAVGLLLSANAFAYIRHEVHRSETLWGIAYKYKVSPDAIIEANPQVAKGLKAGMIIQIPEPGDKPSEKPEAVKGPESLPAETKEVVKAVTTETQETPTVKETPATETAATETEIVTEAVEPYQSVVEQTITTTVIPSVTQQEEIPGIYIAKFGDTFASISKKTGTSLNDILSLNPLLDPDHINEGSYIRISADAPYLMGAAAPKNLLDSIISGVKPEELVLDNQSKIKTIALMLPFDVENETISRQSLLATDFYKGFLIALRHATGRGAMPIKVLAIDTQCDSLTFKHRLQQLVNEEVTIVIPPEDEYQLDKVQQFALQNNILVLNSLNIKDEGYMRYPNVLQCNISQKLMYDKAISALLNDFSDYTPVILDLQGGKDEKNSFIEELRCKYSAEGKKVIDLSFNNRLTDADIAQLPSSGKYIFIPKSGSADVFNKFSDAVVKAIEDDPIDRRYKIFGYPDWILFRGEQEEMLHRMGANIYARFFMDEDKYDTRAVNQEFIRWYGNKMEDVYPSQGMLGYDVGTLIFSALKKNWPDNDFNKFENGSYKGEQSTFHFIKDENNDDGVIPGLINDSLLIIEYLPGAGVYVKNI